MAALAGQSILPFFFGAGRVQAKISFMQLPEIIADRQNAIQEERLAARIEACEIKVSQLVEAQAGTAKLSSEAYALLLHSGKCDYRNVINLIMSNMDIDNLSNAVSDLVFTDMEDYFHTAVLRKADFAISLEKILPPVYVNQVLQEYINTLRVTAVMAQAVNKVCHESLSKIELPWLAKQLADKIELGTILLGAFDCHPQEQNKRVYRQIHLCISGMVRYIKSQVKAQFYKDLMQIYYQVYDDYSKQELKVLLINRQKRAKQKWLKGRKPKYRYKVKEAV